MPNNEKLTERQEKFVEYVAKGMSQRQAYIKAGYKVEGHTETYIDQKASRLMAKGKVRARLRELRKKADTKAKRRENSTVMSMAQKRELLAQIMRGQKQNEITYVDEEGNQNTRFEHRMSDVINAIKADNTMDPDFYELQKPDASISDDPLAAYFAETDGECDSDE